MPYRRSLDVTQAHPEYVRIFKWRDAANGKFYINSSWHNSRVVIDRTGDGSYPPDGDAIPLGQYRLCRMRSIVIACKGTEFEILDFVFVTFDVRDRPL